MDLFQQRKDAILLKVDKSSIGGWDKRVKELCDKINSFEQFYTTSSCSGRVAVMVDQEKKSEGLFQFVSHDSVEFDQFFKSLPRQGGEFDLKFKQEGLILHVACKTLEDANNFLKLAFEVGLKKCGIITLDKRIIVEINASEKLEFPIMKDGEFLVSEEFLKLVLEKSNKNLEKSWLLIEKLEKSL